MKFIKVSELFSDIGEITNCFYSFFLLNKTLYSVHRRHRLFSPDHWPKNESDNLSQIILTEYIHKNPQQISSEKVICNGNDPRVVSDGNRAFVLSEGAVHSDVNYVLTILPEEKNIPIQLGAGVSKGKNWQPLIKDDELYVIDSISPFRENKIDLSTGIITKETEIDSDFNIVASHDNYSILRGGSNAILHADTIYGWGHATVKSYSHIPYIWKYNSNGVVTSFLNIHFVFKNNGYNIVDPCSFFEWDKEHFAFTLSCSQSEWFHPQWFLNALILINKNDFFNANFTRLENLPIRKSIILHTAELDSLISDSLVHGGRFNGGLKGCLVCGPSKEIDISKKWTVELCYSSLQKTSELVGDFDILLTIDGIDKHVGSTQIFGTEGESIRINLSFAEKSENNKALIQTRVFSLGNVSVTAYFFELTYGGE